MLRFSVFCLCLSFCAAPASAGKCDPVETAPGVKSLPKGCPVAKPVSGMKQDAPEKSERESSAKGHTWKYGDAEVHFGGKVVYEAGVGVRH